MPTIDWLEQAKDLADPCRPALFERAIPTDT